MQDKRYLVSVLTVVAEHQVFKEIYNYKHLFHGRTGIEVLNSEAE